MTETTYLIAVDASDDRVDPLRLAEFIRNNPDFTAWWNHIPGCYLVETRLSAEDIAEQVEASVGEFRFLVMEVVTRNSQGRLKQPSWDWIQRRDRKRQLPQEGGAA